jgi:hypothetical protein
LPGVGVLLAPASSSWRPPVAGERHADLVLAIADAIPHESCNPPTGQGEDARWLDRGDDQRPAARIPHCSLDEPLRRGLWLIGQLAHELCLAKARPETLVLLQATFALFIFGRLAQSGQPIREWGATVVAEPDQVMRARKRATQA